MIVFRSDASNLIGTGHVMRCLRLAKKLRNFGKKCFFICSNQKGNLIEKINRDGFQVKIIKKPKNFILKKKNENLIHSSWLGSSLEDDANETIKAIGKIKLNG